MFEGLKRAHFVGIGGIGMSAAAKFLAARGVAVTGSDMKTSAIADALAARGVSVSIGQSALNVPEDAGLIVYSSAVPETNPERVRAKELGVPERSYPEFLGEISKAKRTIVVTGTNGKSTTTAMLGLILEAAGMDPTVIVGSLVPGFPDGNLRVGKGEWFVVEGCEYRANVLNLDPEAIVFTNIEEDHLDYFKDIDHIRQVFQSFADKAKGKGPVAWNADDPQSSTLTLDKGVSYAMEASADINGGNRRVENGKQMIDVVRRGSSLGRLVLSVPGKFNAMNALAASAMAMELGVSFDVCAKTLAAFTGIWRRFERVGTFQGAEVISDYGHHPTAIRGTIEAAREFFPGRRVVLCFQPHQHSRTLELKDEFIAALKDADVAVVPEIYGVTGRTEEEAKLISSQDLVDGVKGSVYAKDLGEAQTILSGVVRDGDVLIIQGAGDVDELARTLCATSSAAV
ncbi:UDP-N-acetylmuramate--L-alanine ligase [Candidatus Uhrbacteria bacterium RIFCSPHIGHO2_01_FULL_63_20]|uniref:UDP-N-acetylmuramate--L-alanine ligase n=1 Tax=Candidatus Uhrbacteria bacterium RIFCSPHIGHO2_01_FULL_63_20 TaxID=1802385 RepID=A0A1F7TLG4_9BACT|nr:MAG: UDP-N-acetylmuramate--L-alanine ligase [Candidatus Uhrbacteria bacterium RIFCSPHIGHO2_01_FULL_63_20]